MQVIDIQSLPRVEFAHIHSAELYFTWFDASTHWIEVTYLAEGRLTLSRKDGEILPVEQGDILCNIHDVYTTVHSDEFHRHHTLGARVDWYRSTAGRGLCLPTVTPASAGTEALRERIDRYVYDPHWHENARAEAARDFLEILFLIDRLNRTTEPPERDLLVTRAKEYIRRHIHQPITQAEVAAYLNVTPQHLCQVFKRAEGITLIKYVNLIKLKNIHSLVENGHRKLYDAAQQFGFSDPNYVSHLYRKTFGRTLTGKPNPSHIIRTKQEE